MRLICVRWEFHLSVQLTMLLHFPLLSIPPSPPPPLITLLPLRSPNYHVYPNCPSSSPLSPPLLLPQLFSLLRLPPPSSPSSLPPSSLLSPPPSPPPPPPPPPDLQLVQFHGLEKGLMPSKKPFSFFGNPKTENLVEMQRQLEVLLTNVVHKFPYPPGELLKFLEYPYCVSPPSLQGWVAFRLWQCRVLAVHLCLAVLHRTC